MSMNRRTLMAGGILAGPVLPAPPASPAVPAAPAADLPGSTAMESAKPR